MINKSILDIIPQRPPTNLIVFNQGEFDQIKYALSILKISFHWVIKLDWDDSHQLPINKKLADNFKSLGEYFLEIYKLCINVLARKNVLPPSLKIYYNEPNEWFFAICKNHVDEIIQTVRYPQDKPYTIENGDLKRNYIRAFLENPKDLENGINPLKNNPHLIDLILLLDAAIDLSEQSLKFKQNYFKPLIDAWRKALKSLDSPNWNFQYVENECLIQKGKGKTKINLTRSHNVNHKPLFGKGSRS